MIEWISVKDRMPEKTQEVIISFVNHKPLPYYRGIKDIPLVGVAVFCGGCWFWYSDLTKDYLTEYGIYGIAANYLLDNALEVTHWMPLPEPPEPAQ